MSDKECRKAVLDALNKWDWQELYLPVHFKDIIDDLPSIQPKTDWIPVSERLPKPFEHCLWTTTDGDVIYRHWDGQISKYKAWMPLPEPYKAESEDK